MNGTSGRLPAVDTNASRSLELNRINAERVPSLWLALAVVRRLSRM